jgi:hypothetical protein
MSISWAEAFMVYLSLSLRPPRFRFEPGRLPYFIGVPFSALGKAREKLYRVLLSKAT